MQTTENQLFALINGGELGIRTPGPVTVNSFQDCRNRPLCQLSMAKIRFEKTQPKKMRKLIYSTTLSFTTTKSCKSTVIGITPT